METHLSESMPPAPPMPARGDWISACQFHDLDEGRVLREVARRVAEVRSKAADRSEAHPLVLLDLDSTLYEVGPRTLRILREWADRDESSAHPEARAAVDALREEQVGYTIGDSLEAAGLDLSTPEARRALEDAKRFWSERFFTNAYLEHDRPYPGAVEFARELHELGAEIVYLTGRDEPGMGEGTRRNLVRDGFPWERERTHLLLKPVFELSDVEHKQRAAEYIRRHGTLVASFENEPRNLVALHELFPEAMHVFMDTVCSDHGAMPRHGLYRIRGFRASG
jgi:hypothetical protein